MGGACLLVAGKQIMLATAAFTLSWTHSVEKTEWQEHWRVGADGLRLVEARVKGSGAGMDPGDGARLENGWWVWPTEVPAIPKLVLAASGATVGGWTLCHDDGCRTMGTEPGRPLTLETCRP
jgi:hypothetical protein